jgi:hypothetical protein
MAGLLQADFIQPQSNTGLFILSPTGSTMATVNTAGIYSSTGAQMLNASGNFGSPTANAITVTGAITGNTVTSNTVVLPGSTSGSVSLVAPAVAGTTTATLPAATGTVMVSGNMPAFSATGNATQTISSGVDTLIQYNTITFDTNSNFNTSTYRFTPTVAGYYQITAAVVFGAAATPIKVAIYKNGSQYTFQSGYGNSTSSSTFACTAILYLNGSTDYLQIYAYQGSGGSLTVGSDGVIRPFSGAMIRSA